MARMLPPLVALTLLAACQAASDPAPVARQAAAAPAAATANLLLDPASGADCAGKDVRITRARSRTVLHGQCGVITIAADDATLNVDDAREIVIEGRRTMLLNERVARVRASGDDAVLNLTEVGTATLAGNRARLTARTLRSVTFTGDGNVANVDNTPVLDDRGRGNKVM